MNRRSEKSRAVRTAWRVRTAWATLLLLALNCGAATSRAFTPADADAIFEAHAKAFYREKDNRAWFTKNTDEGKADFWMAAEQLEMVLDAYERTKNPKQLEMFTKLFKGFLADHGKTWERNPFNDDIMWMTIACTRAYLLTKNVEFRDVARANFDLCYARAATADLGGGLLWKVGVQSKNACVNGPGAIAAFLLSRALGDDTYMKKARGIFLWERANLFEAATGRVFDNMRPDGRVSRMALTYNEGTFVGAAHLLGYTAEAKLAASYTMNQLCRDGFLPPGGENGDGGGFNGIAVRWIARFMKERGEQATFEPWLQKNAEAAWQARRASDGLSWCRWPQPTPDDRKFSWGCSSAVVIMQVVPPAPVAAAPVKPAAPAAAKPAPPLNAK